MHQTLIEVHFFACRSQAYRRAPGARLQEQPPHGGLVKLAQRCDRRGGRRHGFGGEGGLASRHCAVHRMKRVGSCLSGIRLGSWVINLQSALPHTFRDEQPNRQSSRQKSELYASGDTKLRNRHCAQNP